MPLRSLAPLICSILVLAGGGVASAQSPPRTGFEEREGASWTTIDEERAFLAAVEAQSRRVRVTQAGSSKEGRPIQLVELGHPAPAGRDVALARPTMLLVCTQHGNEPAGREACLSEIRDLALATDAGVLSRATVLVMPLANPDGFTADQRGNADGTDINRDHLGLETPEARAIAQVVRDWQPDVVLDHHEYGGVPVVYDDDITWLWPRNLNADEEIRKAAEDLGRRWLVPAVQEDGFTADEYGQLALGDHDVVQTAGDADEGIARNAMGLRHVLGVLVESRVDAGPVSDPMEAIDTAAVARRRVASHRAVMRGALRFLGERGEAVASLTAQAAARKAQEGAARSAPVYFGGADNQPPAEGEAVSPPPCGYRLNDDQAIALEQRFALLGIESHRLPGGPFVSLAQPAEPLIPLLLDGRGRRHVTEAQPLDSCPEIPPPAPARPVSRSRCTVTVRLPRVRGRILSATARIGRRTVRLNRKRRSARLRIRSGEAVRVRLTLRVRRNGRTRTIRAVRALPRCP